MLTAQPQRLPSICHPLKLIGIGSLASLSLHGKNVTLRFSKVYFWGSHASGISSHHNSAFIRLHHFHDFHSFSIIDIVLIIVIAIVIISINIVIISISIIIVIIITIITITIIILTTIIVITITIITTTYQVTTAIIITTIIVVILITVPTNSWSHRACSHLNESEETMNQWDKYQWEERNLPEWNECRCCMILCIFIQNTRLIKHQLNTEPTGSEVSTMYWKAMQTEARELTNVAGGSSYHLSKSHIQKQQYVILQYFGFWIGLYYKLYGNHIMSHVAVSVWIMFKCSKEIEAPAEKMSSSKAQSRSWPIGRQPPDPLRTGCPNANSSRQVIIFSMFTHVAQEAWDVGSPKRSKAAVGGALYWPLLNLA